jgi:hypothetical protein
MGIGIDITKVDLMPQDPKTDNGFKKRFIDFTWNTKSIFKSLYEQGVVYSIPDQIARGGIRTVPIGSKDISTQMITNYKDAKETYAIDNSVTTKYFLRKHVLVLLIEKHLKT